MATSSFRFIKGNTYQLRAIQITTDKQGKLMASEPKGSKDEMGPIVMALDDTGGECWCQIDGHDSPVRVHPNKVIGTEACAKYVGGLKSARSDSQPGIMTPAAALSRDPVAALKAAKERVTAAVAAKEKAEQDYRNLVKAAQALAKAAEEALIEQDELPAETTFEQASA